MSEDFGGLDDLEALRKINENFSLEAKEKRAVEKFKSGEVLEVQKKNVFGKIKPGVSIGGEVVSGSGSGYYKYGNNKEIVEVVLNSASNFFMGEIGVTDPDYKRNVGEIVNSQFLSVLPIEGKPDRVSVSISFYQENAPGSRGYHTPAFVQTEMSRDTANLFLERIKKDPDELARFFDKNFGDLDAKGVKRVAASEFYIFDEKDNAELEEYKKEVRSGEHLPNRTKEFVDFYLRPKKRYAYSQNQGTGKRTMEKII